MLKIKDKVDLKVLEKFGFVYDDWSNIYVLCDNYIVDDDIYCYFILKVNYITREVFLETKNFENCIDVLYDLIQANLVEKVEEC